MIKRKLEQKVVQKLFDRKAIVLMGPRQVGKTTFLKEILIASDKKSLYLLCDDTLIKSQLENANTALLRACC